MCPPWDWRIAVIPKQPGQSSRTCSQYLFMFIPPLFPPGYFSTTNDSFLSSIIHPQTITHTSDCLKIRTKHLSRNSSFNAPCDKDVTLIIAKINISFIWPYDLFPVQTWIMLVKSHPGHASLAMVLGKKRHLSGYTMMVTCIVEDMPDGGVIHIKPKLVSDLSKRCTALFSCGLHNMLFVCLCKLWKMPRMQSIFSWTCLFKLVYNAMSCANIDAKSCCCLRD